MNMAARKGQAGMEYMATYGWAILVVLIIALVLWQFGVFEGGTPTAGFVGFAGLKPLEYACVPGPGNSDTLKVIFVNNAGASVRNVKLIVGSRSEPCADYLPVNNITTCSITGISCGSDESGDRFEIDVVLEYDSFVGTIRKSAGTIWGPSD
jgi:hypothetical protein